MHFLILLKRENVPAHDIMCFYVVNFTRLVSREYCTPLYPHALPAFLSEDLKRDQKRAPSHYFLLAFHIITIEHFITLEL